MIALPGIEGADPLAIYRLIGRLNAAISSKGTQADVVKFLRHFDFKRHERERSTDYGEVSYYKDDKFIWKRFSENVIYGVRCSALVEAGFPGYAVSPKRISYRYSDKLKMEYRDDVQCLQQALKERWRRLSEHSPATAILWRESDELTRSFLLGRACDLVSFGEEIANVTFPPFNERYWVWRGKAAHAPLSFADCAVCNREEAVKALVWLLKDTQEDIVRAEERRKEAYKRESIEKECGREVVKIAYSPPAMLSPRVLSADERRELRQACVDKLRQADEETQKIVGTIDELARVCQLLSQPENQILIPSGQYIERQVNARTEQDMTNEMARELVELPSFIAYAKVLQERGGVEGVWKGKIHTLKLEALAEGQGAGKERHDEIERRSLSYLKRREEIEEESRQRQEGWRRISVDEVPPSVSQGDGPVAGSPKARVVGRDEPPPISHR